MSEFGCASVCSWSHFDARPVQCRLRAFPCASAASTALKPRQHAPGECLNFRNASDTPFCLCLFHWAAYLLLGIVSGCAPVGLLSRLNWPLSFVATPWTQTALALRFGLSPQ